MYTIMWVDSDHHNTHSCVRNNLEDAIKVADKTGGHVYDENTDRVYPEEEHTLSYEDLRALNSVLVRRVPEVLAAVVAKK